MVSIVVFFYILAAICFGMGWFNAPRLNWMAGGLMWLTISLIFGGLL